MDLQVERVENGWLVTGKDIKATVFGSVNWGPNGNVIGKGSIKFRKEILEAVKLFRYPNK